MAAKICKEGEDMKLIAEMERIEEASDGEE